MSYVITELVMNSWNVVKKSKILAFVSIAFLWAHHSIFCVIFDVVLSK